ncbi:DNA alkylation repair protein [Amycolatopsis acidiphila]|uniref:DNA alkylation repair protein n=1 Tax=Amycolatopsis acidiphila TaxID=715473 RepID=A0A557ZVJ2_9PSEU|nr:DNA alkylation repair protein [Amycolatopsis acidiphila]TVT16053.1 DNA alkylation repair protein [Amycolatopsis acidiphila]UIJ62267.1 DNA alkylation repair protein [Amycolatopsis acidiphila]GHG93006.1 DNA alkylation repair protein [Amycolatopsis acidiphila]
MDKVDGFVAAVRAALAAAGDPVKAPEMRRYMKSEMPFHGVPKPERQAVTRRLFAQYPLPDRDSFVGAARKLWQEAEFREERYVAIDLTGHRGYAQWQDSSLLPLHEEMIVTGAWWDYVDEIAVRRVGPILRGEPAVVDPVLRSWAVDADHWRRRTAIICQLGAKDGIDLGLLTFAIEASIVEGDFFLRKGIGWALRQHARLDPAWVRRFVDEHPGLSPLSVREALKHLPR